MEQEFWGEIKSKLKKQAHTHPQAALVDIAEFSGFDSKKLSLTFPDSFSREQFTDKCLPALRSILSEQIQTSIEIALSVCNTKVDENTGIVLAPFNPFDSKYTFETFVVGGANQFAHAACQAVSRQPGQCYNPLFIFGKAGLGKTHLLRAIGFAIQNDQPNLKVLFLTSESFMNDMIQAIRTDRMKEFREKYRWGCDVLLLDDIQFLAKKERTQEEFFYTFNYLHESKKQIIITSDRYPKDIDGLEKRLQTRFEWGLVADIQPPEIETRIAILKNKADRSHIELPDDVAEYIATHITSNIRELEGSLHRLEAHASLVGASISKSLAEQILSDIAPKTPHKLTAEGILKLVALHFTLRTHDLRSEKRNRKLSIPRQICMYLLRKHLLMSYPEIGKFMGGKDHSTVMHGVTKISELLRIDTDILQHTIAIEGSIR